MSAPRTNLETQKRRHLAPLLGMALVVVFGVALIVYWQFEEAAGGNSPAPDAALPTSTGTDPVAAPVADD